MEHILLENCKATEFVEFDASFAENGPNSHEFGNKNLHPDSLSVRLEGWKLSGPKRIEV